MQEKRLRNLMAQDKFVVTAEYVPLPGHRLANFEKFLNGYAEKGEQLPDWAALSGVTIPQSPGGVASMSPLDIFAVLDKKGLWGDLDVIPHVTTKDHNCDAIESYMVGIQKMGLESVLALTGDKPALSAGVFEVDAIGLIEMIKEMNNKAFDKAKAGAFDKVHQFYIAAAVSQYKYTEASQMQQYYKMAKKIAVGADCLMTQLGWDWRKCEELLKYMAEEGIDTPVLGNVYFLTTMTPAPRLMYEGKLPGCVVTKELFEKLQSETPEQHLDRAAQQVAMFRDLGVKGADIGGIFDFDMLVEILQKAEQIGANWRDHADNLCFAPAGGWYLYDQDGKRRKLSHPAKKLSKRNYDMFHWMMFTPGKGIRGPVKKVFSLSKSMREGGPGLGRAFHAMFEKPMKSLLFHCEECGDCMLSENFSICSIGRCEKGLDNAPCGDANPDGTCGNNEEIQCVGELIYQAAASEGCEGLEKLAKQINPKRNPQLAGTASILNNFFERDHCRKVDLIQIGDNVHALIPKVGGAIEEVLANDNGDDCAAMRFLTAQVSGQAMHHGDYVAVNIDKFAGDDPAAAATLMERLVRLVKKQGLGAAVCADSAHASVLDAALKEWYRAAAADAAGPILKTADAGTAETVMGLRAGNSFSLMFHLSSDSIDGLYNEAKGLFQSARNKGFAADEVIFELPVKALVKDDVADGASWTHQVFEAAKRIKADASMSEVHLAVGVADASRGAPGRSIGVQRAFVAAAMGYGVDTISADTTKNFGYTAAAGDLVKLVDAFARQDGAPAARQKAHDALEAFCKANQKAKK